MRTHFLGSMFLGAALLASTMIVSSDAMSATDVKPAQPVAAGASVNLPSFADMVQPLIPAVVNISVISLVDGKMDMMPPDMPFPKGSPFDDMFRDFFDRMQPEGPRSATSLGSGFIIDPKGYIVTNNHVVGDGDQITVTMNDGTELKAKLVGKDKRTDIALLKVEADKPLPYVAWATSDELRVGDWILAIGNPFGLGSTVTAGIASHLARDIGSRPGQPASSDFIEGYIQTDASINMGNSGGPMFDTKGHVVGVTTAIYSPTGGNVGIGFAIPASIAKKVVEQIRQFGRTKRGWIGVRIQNITPDIAESLGLPSSDGALIGSVVANGPAAKASIQSGDVILKVNGAAIKESRDLPRMIGNLNINTNAELAVWRKGKLTTFNIKVGEYEVAEQNGALATNDLKKAVGPAVSSLGMTLQKITPELVQRFDLDETLKEGVIVVEVDRQSGAADKGIRPGDVILEISQEPVASPQDMVQKIQLAEQQSRKSVLLLVNRGGEVRYISLRLSDAKS